MTKPVLIGIAGGTASGKSTLCNAILQRLEQTRSSEHHRILILRLDSFYLPLNPAQNEPGTVNFDHPDAFDWVRLRQTLTALREKKPVLIPRYDYGSGQLVESQNVVSPAPDIILVEGILVLYDAQVREMLSMKIFIDEDSDVRLSRRVLRDMGTFKRPIDSILRNYVNFVKPAFDDFIFPTKRYSDIIIPRGMENPVALDLIALHLNDILTEKKSLTPKKNASSQHAIEVDPPKPEFVELTE